MQAEAPETVCIQNHPSHAHLLVIAIEQLLDILTQRLFYIMSKSCVINKEYIFNDIFVEGDLALVQ